MLNVQEKAHDEGFALSFAQERLWLLSQVADNAAYNIAGAVRLDGRLDKAALESAINEIVRRHEILRTSFIEVDGRPVQRIHEQVSFQLREKDVRENGDSATEHTIEAELTAEASAHFDLSSPGLLRAHLFTVDADQCVLLLVMHHIVSDDWSLHVFIRELEQLYGFYTHEAKDHKLLLPELEIQYVDYAAWQRGLLSDNFLKDGLAYWKKQLRGAPAVLQLPADFSQINSSGRSAVARFSLSRRLSQALAELSRRNQITVYTFLLSAWQLMLWRFTGQAEVIAGTPVSERQTIQTEGLIGLFVNLLPLRSRIEPQKTFIEFGRQAKETVLEAQKYQHVPFEKIVDQLSTSRTRSNMPLVQAVLAWQPDFVDTVQLGTATGKIETVETGRSKFELTLMMRQRDSQIEGELEYDADLFASATVERMVNWLTVLFERIVAAPDERIENLTVLTPADYMQVESWNQTKTSYPQESTVPSLFEQIVQARSTATAVLSDQETITYQELNTRANQLAHYLRALGAGPEARVGICLQRSIEMIVGILAVLKAGAAYVPLDASYPAARLEFMAADADLKVLLTTTALRERIAGRQRSVVLLDRNDEIGRHSGQNPPSLVRPDDLAYVIYTSGSTGTPKGVAVTHRNIVRLVRNTNYAAFSEDDVFLQFAPISFDASTFEIWGALLNGSRLALACAEELSLDRLGAELRRFGVTTLWLTAGLFHVMVEEHLEDLRGLRQLLAGGDVLRTNLIETALRELPGCRLINGYGPTECTTFSCCCLLNNYTEFSRSVPIGPPISNATAYVLDEQMGVAPIGVAGELYLGGDGLGRGYLNRPDLTAEKFVPDHVSGNSGARLYRTGDHARYLANGNLEFLGRVDGQVKICGFRIELEEIENVIATHPAVSDCAVTVREDVPGHKRLIAYLVPTAGFDNPEINEFRDYIKTRLPEYMAPSAFVWMDKLPLTANGKVDRNALPSPDYPMEPLHDVQTFTAAEFTVAEVWQSLLGIQEMRPWDNFFALGGNSLLAAQMVSRLRRKFECEIPVRLAFESATLSEFAGAITKLKPANSRPPLIRRSNDGDHAVSFGQERLWFMEHLGGTAGAYNIAGAAILRGDLQPEILEAALRTIINRHEVLRTSFVHDSGELRQRVHEQIEFALTRKWSGESGHILEDVLRTEATRAFNLSEPGLIRATLIELPDQQYVLALVLHHIVADGWSVGVLIRELNEIYSALQMGGSPRLDPLPIRYTDYAAWQRELLAGDEMRAGLEYWKTQLRNAATFLQLPVDRVQPARFDARGSKIDFSLGRELSLRIESFARKQESTPYAVLLAAFQILLAMYTGQYDLLIGSPVADRQHADTERLIGLFVNLVVLKARVEPEKTFLELLRQAKGTIAESQNYQNVPFEKVVELVETAHSVPEMPLVQVVFAWQDGLACPLELGSARGNFSAIDTGTAKFHLTLGMWADENGEIRGTAEYATSLFDRETIQRLTGHYVTLINSAVSVPNSRIYILDCMSEAERKQVLSWSKGVHVAHAQFSVLAMFELCRRKYADHPAIEAAGQRTTYEQLDQQSNQLARYFMRSGVSNQKVVGICMERSAEAVIAMLATLKAGAAYVVLDPQFPPARLKYILQNADVTVLCGTAALLEQFGEEPRPRIPVDLLAAAIAEESPEALPIHPHEDELAYLIYTSGSTGQPKGVQITHRGLRNLLAWHGQTFGLSVHDRASQVATLSFDASVWEIWSALSCGATLCIAPEEARLSPAYLHDWLLQERITASFLPTPLAEEILRMEWPASGALRLLLTGGDRLRRAPDTQLPFVFVNNYGPTECAVVTTSGEVFADRPTENLPSIGRPINNARCYVLDGYLRVVPQGVTGELYIAGEGVARGYTRNPELTAERFIPDIVSDEPGSRMYRTGDMVCHLPDGRLRFIGRRDDQIKLRGHRIELQEIAAVLRNLEEVADAVVILRPNHADQGSERLVAYVVAQKDELIDMEMVHREIRFHLPEYMCPAAFVIVDALPLTPSGKIDTKALPEPPVLNHTDQGAVFTPVEELIASVWATLLHVPELHPDSNLFELGGHSLLAAQMILRLRKMFHCELPLRLGFECRTLRELAIAVESLTRPGSISATPIARAPRTETLPLSSAQERLWFLDHMMPGNSAYNIPCALRLTGDLNKAALESSFKEIIRRHEVLRTGFVQKGPKPQQDIHEEVTFALQEKDLVETGFSTASTAAVERELLQALEKGFVLSDGGLLRVQLYRTSEQEWLLLAVLHHIVADGRSIEIFTDELTELYAAFSQGRPSPLAELEIQYADYAVWQRAQVAQGAMQQGLEFWKEQLKDAPRSLDLPTDHSRPAVQSFSGASEEWDLPIELCADLRRVSRQQGATLFMTLLAAFHILLHRYSGQSDITVGSPVANRTRSELTNLIGFFVNLLALRVKLENDPSLELVLQQVRERCLAAYANQEIPFDKLVEELGLPRDLSRNPLFQVLFVLQKSVPDLRLPGLEATAVPVASTTAKFDLSLVAVEAPETLKLVAEYSTRLYEKATIRQMMRHYQEVLKAIVKDTRQPLSALTLLNAEEQQQLITSWNSTQVAWPEQPCTVVEMIESQVQRTPNAVAVEFGGKALSYSELNGRANQLARYLRNCGVQADERVVLCLERSLEMVIGILGVLKAGAAYVPVDESYPEERVRYMLSDAGTKRVLSQEKVKNRFYGVAEDGLEWTSLDTLWNEIGNLPEENLTVHIAPERLAYVIYTSGSTGLPKGAMNTHSGLRNRLLWMQQAYQLDTQDRVLQKTPFSFDVSVWEFLWPLMYGARLIVAKPGGHRDNSYLAEVIQQRQITTLHFVPSMLQSFLEHAEVTRCTSLKRVIVSGEALTAEVVEKWKERSNAPLHNLYGPTEASIDVSFWDCTQSKEWGVPIGRPIANTQLYILDDHLRLAPSGVIGELYIGGAGLGRGYWNRPDLTAERFIPDPFSGRTGERMYQTGDRARYREHGIIEYVGRKDGQIKLRGYRIELSEIEAVLRQQAEVSEAAVAIQERRSGDKRLVAYVVCEGKDHVPGQEQPWIEGLKSQLKKRLPEYMIPAAWALVPTLPINANGKLDRKALANLRVAEAVTSGSKGLPKTVTQQRIAAVFKQALGTDEVGIEDNFFDLGGHSLLLAEVHKNLQETFRADLQMVDLFQYPTVQSLAEYLDSKKNAAILTIEMPRPVRLEPLSDSSDLAIIGMAGRFPGADSVEEFWQNLSAGVESITEFSDEELRSEGVEEELLRSSSYVKRGAVLRNYDMFDARFFNFSTREAEITDPQHRLFLECAWETLENAGYNPDIYKGRIGVYAGSFASTYFLSLYGSYDAADTLSLFFANGNDFLSTRVSYKLNLTGPSLTLQCGCSTSLVAVHMACRALLNHECDMAMAGGVAIKVPHKTGYYYQEGGVFSKDGHCRSFDARAQGTVGGNGVGIVLIKRLADAIRDRDCIRAVIKGSAMNNDGADKMGYTAPSITGQREVILQAQGQGGIDPETISYIEAHGTGTALGDPVEITALTQAFSKSTDKKQFCAIGSVKTNVGHLDTAAGVAGLIKTVLALEHAVIPPSLHFERPNPKIDFADSPFYVNVELKDWKRSSVPRRAGVSSFGIGGTNAHIILEEAPSLRPAGKHRPWQLLALSAKSKHALECATDNLWRHLEQRPCDRVADVAHTLQLGRKSFAYRRFLIATDTEDAVQALKSKDDKRVLSSPAPVQQLPIAFLFPGHGSQFVNMGHGLYQQEPVFREKVDLCCSQLLPILGFDLRNVLYPEAENREWAQAELGEPRTTQSALFVVEYALAKLWMSWGVMPEAMIGHSIGEYAAACLAGVLSLEDALRLVVIRGRLMQECAPGAMLAVMVGEEEARKFLGSNLDLAAVNSGSVCVLAGTLESIQDAEKELTRRGIVHRRLRSVRAFHSRMMDPIVERFAAELQKIHFQRPVLPYLSNVTGDWVHGDEVVDPGYWIHHLRGTVRFAAEAVQLCRERSWAVLEVGPGHSTIGALRQSVPATQVAVAATALPEQHEGEAEQKHMLTSLANLWLKGTPVDWNAFAQHEDRMRVQLPTYPFERQRYWIQPGRPAAHQKLECAISVQDLPEDTEVHENSGNVVPVSGDEVEVVLTRIWQEALGTQVIARTDNFFELGGDSLIALKMTARAQELGCGFTIEQLFACPTIAALGAKVCEARSAQSAEVAALEVLPEHEAALRNRTFSVRWALLALRNDLDINKLKKAIHALVSAHDSLRMRFLQSESGYQQRPLAADECHFWIEVDLTAVPEQEQLHRIETALEETRLQLQPEGGEVFQAVLFRTGDSASRLYLQALDTVADSVSLGLICRGIEEQYLRPRGQDSTAQSSYLRWRSHLEERTKTMALREGQEVGTPRPGALPKHIPVDFPAQANTCDSVRSYSVALGESISLPLIEDLPARFRCDLWTVLLTGLVQGFSRWTGNNQLSVELMLDGRTLLSSEDKSFRDAIGAFSTPFPATLKLERSARGTSALKSIKEQMVRESNSAIARKWARGLNSEPDTNTPELWFDSNIQENSVPTLFSVEKDYWTEPRANGNLRKHILELSVARKQNNQLIFKWTYSSHLHREATIQRLAGIYFEYLKSLVAASRCDQKLTYSPSDFPEAQLSQRELDSLLAKIAVGQG